MTGRAGLLARDVQLHLGASNRLPEIDVEPVFEIRAALGLLLRGGRASAPAEKAAEDVAERTASEAFAFFRARLLLLTHVFGEIESAESGSAALAAAAIGRNVGRIESVLVVDLALLFVVQYVVGFLNVLEPLFGGFVAGVQIGVILSRQLAISFAYLLRIRALGHSQGFVVIFFACSRHRNSIHKRRGHPARTECPLCAKAPSHEIGRA